MTRWKNPTGNLTLLVSQDFSWFNWLKFTNFTFLLYFFSLKIVSPWYFGGYCEYLVAVFAWFLFYSWIFTSNTPIATDNGGRRHPSVALRTQGIWPRRGKLKRFHYFSPISCLSTQLLVLLTVKHRYETPQERNYPCPRILNLNSNIVDFIKNNKFNEKEERSSWSRPWQ